MESLNIAKKVISIEMKAIERLKSNLSESFSQAVELIYQSQGRVIISGLGKSGAIARKIAATLASTGTPAYFLHAAEGLHGDIGMVHKNDVVIGISKSGNTPEVNQLLPVFKRLGVPVIAFTGNLNSRLAKNSDIVLDISVEEEACPNDLAPTASTTVSLVLGDALAVALLEKRNFTENDFAFLHPAGSLGKKLLWHVDDVMETGDRLGLLSENSTMKEATIEMANKRGICVVTDDANVLLGVLTTGDLNRLLTREELFFHIPVTDVMNRQPIVINSETLATYALSQMEKHQIMAMPVVDDQRKLLGIIHFHDILDAGVN